MKRHIDKQHEQMHLNFVASLGLLPIRLMAGLAMLMHGLPKLARATTWMDGTGFPAAPGWLQFLVAWIQVLGGVAWLLGLATPYASLGLFGVMAVGLLHRLNAGQMFVAEAGVGLPSAQTFETAALYVAISLLFLTVGPGTFSVDAWLGARRRRRS